MKFSPFQWKEIANEKPQQVGTGRVLVQCSAPVALFVESEGVTACAGYAASFDLVLSDAAQIRVSGPKGVRAFLFDPERSSVPARGEVFTNIDRMPGESGALAEVLKARRILDLEMREARIAIRAEAQRFRLAREAAAAEAAPAAVEPVDAEQARLKAAGRSKADPGLSAHNIAEGAAE